MAERLQKFNYKREKNFIYSTMKLLLYKHCDHAKVINLKEAFSL